MSISAFDAYAEEYDGHFTQSPIGILQRKRVFHYLAPLLSKEKNVLELNCGTGEDALAISPFVNSVLATDISEDMILVANAKKKNIKNVCFEPRDTRSLHKGLQKKYDIVFSDFGGLNCLSKQELQQFSKDIFPFIEKDGKLILVIMGRKCVWENLLFWKQKDSRYKRRETLKGIDTKINSSTFLTYYYAPKEIGTIFGEKFTVIAHKPIGIFVPPSYFNNYFENRKLRLKFLSFLEKRLGGFSFLSNYADHYLIILEKIKEGEN